MNRLKSSVVVSAAVLFTLLISPGMTVSAATLTWDGGAGTTNWWDANNWSGNALPGITDTVNLTASVATSTNKPNLTFSGWGSGDSSVGGLRLNLNSGAALHVLGTLWVGYGDNGPTPPAVIVTQNAGSSVTVDQWLNVGYYTGSTDNQYTLNGGTLKIGASLQRDYSAGRNEGLVFQGGTLQVATIAASVSNQTQSASVANSVLDVTVNNTTLNANYTAAELATANTASILVGASRTLTLGANITLSLGRNARMEVSGTLTGGSGSKLSLTHGSTILTLNDGSVVNGGEIDLSGDAGQTIHAASTTATTVIAPPIILSGADKTFAVDDGAAAADLLLGGNISQSGGATGIIKTGPGVLSLGGTNSYGGATTILEGGLRPTHALAVSGSASLITGASGTLDLSGIPGGFALAGSQSLRGFGTVTGSVVASGIVSPGTNGIGVLTFNNDLAFTAEGRMAVELAADGSNDTVSVSGSTGLAGTLTVTTLNGYTPIPGDRYDVLTSASALSGAFQNAIVPPLVPWQGWLVEYSNNTVSVCVTGAPTVMLVSPGSQSFGAVYPGSNTTASFLVTNSSPGATINGTAVIPGGPSAFQIVSGSPFTLLPGETTTIVIAFSPDAVGVITGSVVIACDAGMIYTNPLEGAGATLAMEFHVAPNGSDGNDGTESSPFATLEKARDWARCSLGKSPVSPATIWIHGGGYLRTNTLVLTHLDSNCRYLAVAGEQPRLIGGPSLDPAWFSPVSSSSPVWSRLAPAAQGVVLEVNLAAHGITEYGTLQRRGFGSLNSRTAPMELFVDGRTQTLGRWPNGTAYAQIATIINLTNFTYSGTQPSRWTQAEELWVSGYFCGLLWAHQTFKVAALNTTTRTITLPAAPSYDQIQTNMPYTAFNLLEEIDTPGEYYINRNTGMLYYWPSNGFASATIVLSAMETPMLDVTGAENLALEGLEMLGARGMLVRMNSGTNVVFTRCRLLGAGAYAAVSLNGTNSGLMRCEIADSGGAGVRLDGGDRRTLTPGGNFVRQCSIHHFERLDFTYAPAVDLYGCGQIVEHCELAYAPHTALKFDSNNCLIQYNNIHHVCQWTADAAAIYSWNSWARYGNQFRFNHLHDIPNTFKGTGIPDSEYECSAFYMDNAIAGETFVGNVIYNVGGAGFINSGRDNVYRNNVVAQCGTFFNCAAYGDKAALLASVLPFNYQSPPWSLAYPMLAAIPNDSNLITSQHLYGNVAFTNNVGWRNPGGIVNNGGFPYCAFGNNPTNSDPLFVNEAARDLTLRGNSPAFSLPGFQAIPFGDIGMTPLRWDANGGASNPQEGDGLWRDLGGNWWDGATGGNALWRNAFPCDVVFGSTNGATRFTVTLGSTITAGNLTFAGQDYAIVPDASALYGLDLPGMPVITTVSNATIIASITGGGFIKAGAATLFLNGTNTAPGLLTVTAGTLAVGGAGLLGSGNYTMPLTNSAALAIASSANQTLGGIISGSGSVTKSGSGTLTLTALNTYTGGTTVNGGVLTLPSGGTSGIIRGSLSITSGACVNASQSWAFGYGANSIDVTNIVINGGVLNFTAGSGGYAGFTITMTGGAISNGFQLGGGVAGTTTPAIITLASPQTATMDGFLMRENLTYTTFNVAAGATPSGVDLAIGGPLSQNGVPIGIVKTGAGVLGLSGNSTFTGPVTISAGTLAILGAGRLGGGNYTAAITNNAALVFSGSANQTLGGIIRGSGSLTRSGTGTLTLAANDTYTGPTTLASGTLILASGNALSTNSAVILAGGALDAGTLTNTVGSLTLGSGDSTILLGPGSLHFLNSAANTWSGRLAVSGMLGAQSLRFGTDNTGLTLTQLARITVNGCRVELDSEGYARLARGMMILIQ